MGRADPRRVRADRGALDAAHGGRAYRETLDAAIAALKDSSLTHSARVLRDMHAHHGNSHPRFALAQSLAHRQALLGLAFAPAVEARLEQLARESLEEQRRIEAADRVPFETYRQQYLAQDLLDTPGAP